MQPRLQRSLNCALGLAATVALTACGDSASTRCDRLAQAQAVGPLLRDRRDQDAQNVLRRFQALPPDTQTALLSRITSHDAQEEATLGPLEDSVTPSRIARRYALFFAHDSLLPQVTQAPEPAELAWYEEHCHDGKPR